MWRRASLALAFLLCAVLPALAQNADAEVTRLLGKITDPKPSIRLAAFEKLRHYLVFTNPDFPVPTPRHDKVLPAFLKALDDPAPEVRRLAARELGSKEIVEAVEPLLRLLADPDEQVRRAASSSLGEIRDPRAVEPLLEVFTHDTSPVRAAAAEALGRLGDARAVEPLLAALAADTDAAVQRSAVRALEPFPGPFVTDGLLSAARRAGHLARREAVAALGCRIDIRIFPTLKACLQDPAVQNEAIDALSQTGDPRAVELLLPLLNVPAARHRVLAVIGRFRDERTVEPISALITRKAVSGELLIHAIEALGATRDPRAIPALLPCLKMRNTGTLSPCRSALHALANLRNTDAAVDALLPLTRDKYVSYEAFTALGPAQSDQAIAALIAGLKTDDSFVRRAVLYSLVQIPDRRAVAAVIDTLATKPMMLGELLDEHYFGELFIRNPQVTADDFRAVLRQEKNPWLWETVLPALGRSQDLHGIDAILGWDAAHGSDQSRELVCAALRPYGVNTVPALLYELKQAEGTPRQVRIAYLLGELGDERAGKPLLALVKKDAAGSDTALLALGQLRIKEALPLLRQKAVSGTTPVRREAIYGLAAARDAESAKLLQSLLAEKSDDPAQEYLRACAAFALGDLEQPDAADALAKALSDAPIVRFAAAYALAQFNDARAIEPLLEQLNGKDAQFVLFAADRLARFDDPRVGSALLQLAAPNSRMWQVAPDLIELLAQRREPGTLDLIAYQVRLLPGLPGDNTFYLSYENEARELAALGTLGDRRTLPLLLREANSANMRIREAAINALTTVTGQDFGDNHAQWVNWWFDHEDTVPGDGIIMTRNPTFSN